MRLNKPAKRRVQDPTIALINIVFLMLIFFLLAGTIAPGADPEIELIETSEAERSAPPADPIGITSEGALRYGGAAIEMDALLAQLSQTSAVPRTPLGTAQVMENDGASSNAGVPADAGKPLAIAADRDLPATVLIDILRDLRQAGFSARIVTRSGGEF